MSIQPSAEIFTTESCLNDIMKYAASRGRTMKVNVKGRSINVQIPEDKFFDALKVAYGHKAEIYFRELQDDFRFQYYNDFKGIVNVSDGTMGKIIELNTREKRFVSIREMSEHYADLYREIMDQQRKTSLDERIKEARLINQEAQKKADVKRKLRKIIATEGRGMQI